MRGIDYWRLSDELTIIQAALLICGYDPTELQDSLRYSGKIPPDGYIAIKHALSTAVKSKALNSKVTKVMDERSGEYYPDDDLALIEVNAIRKWLSAKGIKKHFFFFPEGIEDEFLSEDHPRYSPKLAAAVRAWKAMEGGTLKGKTAKQSVTKWLRLHAESYGLTDDDGKPMETAIGEIAKIVNWNPKGGAPSTPSAVGSDKPNVGSNALAALDKNFAVLKEKKLGDPSNFGLDDEIEIPF